MCYICDGKRDVRIMASIITLLTSIDYSRARMVIMTTQVNSERLRQIIEEESDAEGVALLNLDNLLALEDQPAQSVKAAMLMTSVLEEALERIHAVLALHGPFMVPNTEGSGQADAFTAFLNQMFDDEEDHDHDDE